MRLSSCVVMSLVDIRECRQHFQVHVRMALVFLRI